MSEPNPYSSSVADQTLSDFDLDPNESIRPMAMSIARWSLVSLANMIVPLLFGVQMCNAWAFGGVAVACLAFSGIIYFLSQRPRSFSMPIFVGAIIVGATQIFPVLQIVIGLFAIGSVEWLERGWVEPTDSMVGYGIKTSVGGFAATIMTGTSLLLVSTVIGYTLRYTTPESWWRKKLRDERST